MCGYKLFLKPFQCLWQSDESSLVIPKLSSVMTTVRVVSSLLLLLAIAGNCKNTCFNKSIQQRKRFGNIQLRLCREQIVCVGSINIFCRIHCAAMNHYYYTSQWRSTVQYSTVQYSTVSFHILPVQFRAETFPFNTLMKNLLVPGWSHRYQLIGNRNIAASSDINIKLLKERFPHEIESIFLGAEENTTLKAFNQSFQQTFAKFHISQCPEKRLLARQC